VRSTCPGRRPSLLGFRDHGLARVRVEYVGRAPLEGSNDKQLMATLRENEPAPAPSLVMLASAKPFLPDSGGRSPVLRGEARFQPNVHTISARRASREAAIGAVRSVVTRPNAQPERVAAARQGAWSEAPQRPAISPVSAYAPAGYDPGISASTGRGLY